MPQIYNYKSESEWLELRKRDITSTESSALFGLSPYCSEFELFYIKQSGEESNFVMNDRIMWGQRLEEAIARGVGEDLGCEVAPLKHYSRSDTVPRMGSSFDFEILTGKHKGWLMEIKNVDGLIYRDKWQEDEAPPHIEVQAQHQMEVEDRPGTLIVALVGGNSPKIIERERDRDMGKAICERIHTFWTDIAANKAPEPDFKRDAEFISALYGFSGNEVTDMSGNPEVVELMEQYDTLNQQAKTYEKLRKERKAEILHTCGIVHGAGKGKILTGNITLSYWDVNETPPTTITASMVGQTYGGRKGFQNMRVTRKKVAK